MSTDTPSDGCAHKSCNRGFTAFSQTLDEFEFERSLCGSAVSNDLSRAKKLIENSGRNIVNDCDQYGYTPLHYACRNGNVDMVKLLLQHGADVNKRTKSTLATPLHRACYAGRRDVVRLLLHTHSCDFSLEDVDGEPALTKCTKQEQWPCLRAFIDYCAKQSRNADPNEEVCRKGCPSYVLLQQLLQLVDEPSHTPLDKEIPHDIIASILTIRENIGPS